MQAICDETETTLGRAMLSEWKDWDADPLAPRDWLIWSLTGIAAIICIALWLI